MDRDSPFRGGGGKHLTTEAVGFAETHAFMEQQRVNGGASLDESIVGFEPQYAQPDAVRAADFSTSTPSAGVTTNTARGHAPTMEELLFQAVVDC